MKLHISYILLIIFSLSSCVSLNTHQTGKTIGKGNYQYFGNINYGSIKSETFSSINDKDYITSEIGFLKGVTDRIDIGLKTGNTFRLTGLLKGQVIGDRNSLFASSLGVELGLGGVFETLLGPKGWILKYNTNLSFINSIHPSDFISITFSPKYVHSEILAYNNLKHTDQIYGYTSGVIIGDKTKFSIEIGQFSRQSINILKSKPFIGIGVLLNPN